MLVAAGYEGVAENHIKIDFMCARVEVTIPSSGCGSVQGRRPQRLHSRVWRHHQHVGLAWFVGIRM